MNKNVFKKIALFTVSVVILIGVAVIGNSFLNKIEKLSDDISILEAKNELQSDYINNLNYDVKSLTETNDNLNKENDLLRHELAQ